MGKSASATSPEPTGKCFAGVPAESAGTRKRLAPLVKPPVAFGRVRVLFSSLASYGHTYPMVPLARAALAQGHEVVFTTGAQFLPALRELGLGTAAVGMSIPEGYAAAGAGERRPEPGSEAWKKLMTQVFAGELPRRFAVDLQPVLAATEPDLVVHEAGNHGAGIAAARAGIPGVCHGFGLVAPDDFGDFGPTLRAVAAEFGVELPAGELRALGNPFLDVAPKSLQESELAVQRIPLRPVPFAEPGELPPLGGTRPLIYLTLGTAFGDAEVLGRAIGGLAELDADVLVAAGPTVEPAALGELPANVSVHSWLPQAELLGRVDLIVHHGGSGTMLAAAAAGLPQLLLPRGADQFRNAAAVAELGAGTELLGADVTTANVQDAAKALLGGAQHRRVARELAAEIAAMPSPESVAERLPEFAR